MIRNVLKMIAQCFESEHIVYGLGGSGVLVAYDILENMHDIDIVVALEDIEKAKKIMDIISVLKESGKNCFVATEHNYIYEMNGIKIELMSNIHLKHSQGLYAMPFSKNRVTYRMSVDDMMIPVMSLEDWYVFYQLIQRQDRIDQIEEYFLENGITHGSYLINAIKANIPRQLKVDIVKMMQKMMMD
ncbi:MAG: nucleotidyltransferase family protein [Erysipelotrichales bacterium]|nr:nucleotidyltransferase family protein [Erysipelotrichales bacterium]